MNVSDRIRILREEKGLTLEELAQKVGKTKSTVHKYENGSVKNITNETIMDLAEALGVSPMVLMGWAPIDTATLVRVPVIGSIACGEPLRAEQNVERYIKINADVLPMGDIFMLEANGSSMEPVIPNGSLVLIREQPVLENGELGAFLMNDDNEATLKRYNVMNEDMVMLEPINREYAPIFLSETNPGRILGKVVGVYTDLDK